MPSYSKNEIVLVQYPFSDLTSTKVRPAFIVNAPHASQDVLIVPLTSKTGALLAGEFVLADWKGASLNVETVAKRGIFTTSRLRWGTAKPEKTQLSRSRCALALGV